MKGKDMLEAVGEIDEKIVERADEYRPDNKLPWLRWAAAVCLCAAGAAAIMLLATGKKPISPEPAVASDSTVQPVQQEQGIYLPPVRLPEKSDATMDMIGLIVYKGGVYTQAQDFVGEDAKRVMQIVGERLGTAKGNIDEWSTQSDYAEEFAASTYGEVYAVNGYDTDFRICIKDKYINEENEWVDFVHFYERLNGITVTTGADIFDERLHIRGRVTSMQYQKHEDWDNAIQNYYDITTVTGEQLADFVEELCAGSVDYDVSSFYDEFYSGFSVTGLEIKHLIMHLDDGTSFRLTLFDNGYAAYDGIYIRVGQEAFDIIWNACE